MSRIATARSLLHLACTGRFGAIAARLEARRTARMLLRSRQFDPAFYQAQTGLPPGTDLLRHYAEHGRAAGIPPNPHTTLRWHQARALGTAPGGGLPRGRLVVGIVTYDTAPATLQRAARSVSVAATQAGIRAPLLLLDNGGPASAAVDGAETLPSAGNVGFGAGHNRLMQAAWDRGADYYLALNPDAALHPDALGALLRMAHAADDGALVQAIQFPAEHTVTYDPATFDTPWISGACMLLPRRVVEAVGAFDDAFFMYCEDVDLSWRARSAGFRTLTCPAALLFHPTTDRVLDLHTHKMFLDSGLLLAVKWRDPVFAAFARAELARLGLAEPDLAAIVPVPDPAMADFTHSYAFAPGRW